MIRTFSRRRMDELAARATVPVVNALTDGFHPCQLLADLLTVGAARWHGGADLAFLGDGANNMAHSYLLAGEAGMHVRIAGPAASSPTRRGLARPADRLVHRGFGHITEDPQAAVAGADVVATDTWTSMGQEAEARTAARRSGRTRSTPRCFAAPRRTRSCCTACPRTAARRSPTRCWTARQSPFRPGGEPAARAEGAAGLAAAAGHGTALAWRSWRIGRARRGSPPAAPVPRSWSVADPRPDGCTSQTELAELLAGAELGVVTQATLSRDLEELGAVKVRGEDGWSTSSRRRGPSRCGGRAGAGRPGWRRCGELLTAADASGNLVVLRTPPGAPSSSPARSTAPACPTLWARSPATTRPADRARPTGGGEVLAERMLGLDSTPAPPPRPDQQNHPKEQVP